MADWLAAILLGLIEGLTEFIPVSSTGHLLLLREALGLQGQNWNTFVVMIQLGAILAVISVYFAKLWKVLIGLPTSPEARHFAISVLIAFLPSLFAGVFLYDFITRVLFETPQVICIMLIVGGFLLIAVERFAPQPQHFDAMKLTWKTSLLIGLFQCLALVPGVSRSGATISGSILLKLEKPAAAEFSFFLAIPTMVGAFAYALMKEYETMDFQGFGWVIGVGFVTAFLAGLAVVRFLVNFVGQYGFTPFAFWRIVVGSVGLLAIWLY
ncbi:undecaprenyl-diphosphate phosphatase [Brevundimonas sp.]|jgi:undecaprenyl-diphosphatase|uniref:undecaprenyl-diphosphate phosphatase n=1 Tax=Brevundimonas sp. TaxID=1871086 RepID=UPI002E10E4B5|nr:undecaprenyl-diphosphate phosphatase [Brevundimonas sp.]